MGTVIYRRVPTSKTEPSPKGIGPVLHFPWLPGESEAIEFRCPCGERIIYITSPPHGISFDNEERLTLKGSVGARERGTLPRNWCHLDMTNGIATMYDDSICPGMKL